MQEQNNVVNINVLGRDYPVKCTKEEAEELRTVEKKLNAQLNQYRLKYAQLDKQDCLSMALIENHVDTLSASKDSIEATCMDKIDRLEALIAEHIS